MRGELYGTVQVDAREVLRVLRSAREKLRGGYFMDWCARDGVLPPHTRLGELDPVQVAHSMEGGQLRVHPVGTICASDDEGVRFYDVRGALEASAGANVDVFLICEELLRWVTPGQPLLGGRVPLPEVLLMFDRAVLRAQAVSRRKD